MCERRAFRIKEVFNLLESGVRSACSGAGSAGTASLKPYLRCTGERSAGTAADGEDSPGHYLTLWFKADCQTQNLQVVHLIQIFSHCTVEKISKIHRIGEYNP